MSIFCSSFFLKFFYSKIYYNYKNRAIFVSKSLKKEEKCFSNNKKKVNVITKRNYKGIKGEVKKQGKCIGKIEKIMKCLLWKNDSKIK